MKKVLVKVITGISAAICGLALSGLFVTPVQASTGASGTITDIYVEDYSSAGGTGSTGEAVGSINWSYTGTTANYDDTGAEIYWQDANNTRFMVFVDFEPSEDPYGASGSADFEFTYNGNSYSGTIPLIYQVIYQPNGSIWIYSLEGAITLDESFYDLFNDYFAEESPMSQKISSEINDIKLASNGLAADGSVNADKVVNIEGKGALNSNVFNEIIKADGVTVNYTFEYMGIKFMSTITPETAAAAFKEDVAWYGPCYLANNFPTVVVGVVE